MIILLSWTVNETLRHLPEAATVFNRLGIDTCCGGGLTLAEAAGSAGISGEALIAALAPAVEAA